MIEESKKNKSDTTLNDGKIKYKFKRYVKDRIILSMVCLDCLT